MEENNSLFRENVKNSFKLVKEDIEMLKNENQQLRRALERLIEIIESIRLEMRETGVKREEINQNQPILSGTSNGNSGVIINHHQSSSIIIDDHQSLSPSISDLKVQFEELFKGLTDREFSVFMAIYQLEEELGGKVTSLDLANKLKVSEITIRNYLNTLLSKGTPIEKHRFLHRKSHFSIKKDFKDLKLAQKLLKIRLKDQSQTRLFD